MNVFFAPVFRKVLLVFLKRRVSPFGIRRKKQMGGPSGLAVFSRDIGIDLGTASVLVYIKGKGIVLHEPSVVALDERLHSIIAVGTDALRMMGRTPTGVHVVRPLRDGVVSDYDLTERMLHYYLRKVLGRFSFFRPRVVVCVPSGITEVERRSVVEAMLDAGASDTRLIQEPVAAAIGAGLDIRSAGGSIVVDVGGGTTDIALVSLTSPVIIDSVRCAGDKVDESIVRFMKKKHNVLIGERTAEQIKMQIGIVSPEPPVGTMDVTGRNLVSGLPMTVHITAEEISTAVEEPASRIIEAIHGVLERTPPELASDVFDRGITLTGGGALLSGLSRRVGIETGVPCRVAERPIECVVLGTGRAIEDLDTYGELIHDFRKPQRYDFRRG